MSTASERKASRFWLMVFAIILLSVFCYNWGKGTFSLKIAGYDAIPSAAIYGVTAFFIWLFSKPVTYLQVWESMDSEQASDQDSGSDVDLDLWPSSEADQDSAPEILDMGCDSDSGSSDTSDDSYS